VEFLADLYKLITKQNKTKQKNPKNLFLKSKLKTLCCSNLHTETINVIATY